VNVEPSDQFVVFADMLGFAALTLANPIDLRTLRNSSRPGAWTLDEILNRPKNALTERFSSFHFQVKAAIAIAELSQPVTAITFSDSVFFAAPTLPGATDFAIYLAHGLLTSGVPVRMGIASGSFAALRFRSDVSSDGGDHAAQFLGTAVVRAHQAETCGVKGMRILVHPSIESLFAQQLSVASATRSRRLTFIPLPAEERTNRAQVRYELDYWDLAATKEKRAWQSLQDMWTTATDFSEHYEATARAIDRMRVSQGESPLVNFRRRTLPHRKR
jgi:hypothetical protein